MNPLRKFENWHIGMWLIKDMSWMMDFQLLALIMIIPTITMGAFIMIRSYKSDDFYINLSVFFWILANTTWMCLEFFTTFSTYFSVPFFILGLVSFFIYCYQTRHISVE